LSGFTAHDVEAFVAPVRPGEAERPVVAGRADAKHTALLNRVETGLFLRIGARRYKRYDKQHGESANHENPRLIRLEKNRQFTPLRPGRPPNPFTPA
jgi:hypothetical protein